MKILSIIPDTPQGAQWTRMRKLSNILSELGHQVDIVHFCRELPDTPIYNGDHRYVKATSYNVYLKYIKMIMNDSYDYIIGNTPSGGMVSLPSSIMGPKVILDPHGSIIKEFELENHDSKRSIEYFRRIIVERLPLHISNYVLCVSNNMMEFLKESGIDEHKLYYAPNGVQVDEYSINDQKRNEVRQSLGIDSTFVVGYVGGMQGWQGVTKLEEAAEHLADNITLLIVGGKEDVRKDNIVYKSRVPEHEVANYYAACDLLALPRETHIATEIAGPTKFGEYAAAGKPILTTDVGDPAQFTARYDCGIVVEEADPKLIADAITSTSQSSSEELARMGDNAKLMAEEELSINTLASSISDIIQPN